MVFRGRSVLCLGLISLLLSVSVSNGQIADRFKLSTNARPFHYDLAMKIDVDAQVFSGSVKIDLEVHTPTQNIQLHYKDMTVENIKLIKKGSADEIPGLAVVYSEETEILSVPFSVELSGEYSLSMDFHSKIRTDLKGLYMSTYFDESGEKRHIATTFMAPNYARMAYPCFDEPEFKANYTIHVSHADKYFALSNMPAEDMQTDLGDGWKTTHFLESKPTSSYIVAFIVCDFQKISREDWPLSIYANPTVLPNTEYAMDHFNSVRMAMETYLGRTFQYPKLDMIAIDDFLMGAMENWGLITYLSSRILINDNTTDLKTKIAGSKTLSHELAHQWFGNEVTHNYWNVVWLKEGLATLFEDLLTDRVHPDWRMWDQFVINTMQFVMQQDSVPNVRHMMKTYSTPAEIRAVYDFVTYKKAGSVMRMMMNVLTAPVFQRAMDHYIENNSFATATNVDLAAAFQEAIDESTLDLPDIETVFNSWIKSPGFPVVTVVRDYGEKKTMTIRQKRFIASYSDFGAENQLYRIPLNYAIGKDAIFSDTATQLWLNNREEVFELAAVDNDQWMIFNKLATGYYRVNYDETNWKLISKTLRESHVQIAPSNRAQLIDDALNLARYGQLNYEVALDLISYAKQEDDFVPLTSLLTNLRELERVARGSDLYLEDFFLDLVTELYGQNSLENTDNLQTDVEKLRHVEVVNFACKFGLPQCTESAFQLLTTNFDDEIHPDYRLAVFCGAMQYKFGISDSMAPAALYYRLGMKSASEGVRRRNDKEVNDIFTAFSCVHYEPVLTDILNWTIAGREGVYFEKGDANKIFAAVASANVTGTKVALDFLNSNYATVVAKYESHKGVFEALAPNIVTPELKTLYELLVETKVDKESMKTALDAASLIISENMKWKELRVDSIKDYLGGSGMTIIFNPVVLLLAVVVVVRSVVIQEV